MPIREIRLRAVRGIRHEIQLDLGGKWLLVQGDNGTGKSSIERGLRWALMGVDGPTDDKPFSTEASYRRHVLEDGPRVAVTLTNGGTLEALTDKVEANEQGVKFRQGCCSGNPFLRRLELLDFLTAKGVDRFKYLDSFLDLAAVDKAMVDLNAKVSGYSTKVTTTTEKIQRIVLPLISRLPTDLQPNEQRREILEQSAYKLAVRLKVVEATVEPSWDALCKAAESAASLGTADELEATRAKLVKSQGAIETFAGKIPAAIPTDFEKLVARQKELEAQATDAGLSDLLQHAKTHLEGKPGETCPLCNQPIRHDQLLESVDARLKGLSDFRQTTLSLQSTVARWRQIWRELTELTPTIISVFGINTIAEVPSVPRPAGAEILDNPKLDESKFRVGLVAVGADALAAWIESAVSAARKRISERLADLPAATALGDVRVLVQIVNELTSKRKSLLALEEDLAVFGRCHRSALAIYEAMRKARQDVAQEILNEIGETVADYYSKIHPPEHGCEATAAPTIDVQRHKGGTAFVRGSFAGKEVKDPTWVYSDGHLDTVGICIFLALRRFRANSSGDCRLIVLDDVVLSIDLGHARRLIELLHDEFNDHQVIILTHNRLFSQWCVSLLPDMKKCEVLSWTLENGPFIADYAQAANKLEAQLETGSSKEIAMYLMWLMDEWLAQARFAYTLAVPARNGEQYTLTEIWNPFQSDIKKMLKALGKSEEEVDQYFDGLKDLPAIRNSLAAHENEFAKEFPRTVMVQTAQKAMALVGSLYCSKCCQFAKPMPDRSQIEVLRCKCEEIRIVRPSKPEMKAKKAIPR